MYSFICYYLIEKRKDKRYVFLFFLFFFIDEETKLKMVKSKGCEVEHTLFKIRIIKKIIINLFILLMFAMYQFDVKRYIIVVKMNYEWGLNSFLKNSIIIEVIINNLVQIQGYLILVLFFNIDYPILLYILNEL